MSQTTEYIVDLAQRIGHWSYGIISSILGIVLLMVIVLAMLWRWTVRHETRLRDGWH